MTAASRRKLLGQVACASAAALVVAPAPAMAAVAVDPHVAWGAEWQALLDYCNGSGPWPVDLEDTPEGQRMFELQALIANTPAATLPGVAAQLEVVMEMHDIHPDQEAAGKDLAALRNMRDTMRHLVGTGVIA